MNKLNPLDRIQKWNEIAGKPNHFDLENIKLYAKLIEEEHKEWKEAYEQWLENPCIETMYNLYKELADGLVVITGQFHSFGETASHILESINESNFSKFIHLSEATPERQEQELKIAQEKYGDRYSGIHGELVGDYFVMFSEGGKVIKPSTYEDPKF